MKLYMVTSGHRVQWIRAPGAKQAARAVGRAWYPGARIEKLDGLLGSDAWIGQPMYGSVFTSADHPVQAWGEGVGPFRSPPQAHEIVFAHNPDTGQWQAICETCEQDLGIVQTREEAGTLAQRHTDEEFMRASGQFSDEEIAGLLDSPPEIVLPSEIPVRRYGT